MDRRVRNGIRGSISGAACLMVAACGSGGDPVASAGSEAGAVPEAVTDTGDASDLDWRRVATSGDRGRLRGWRGAWVDALAQADRREVARDPVLFDPDHALVDPLPPPGTYRCRTFKLGARSGTGLSFVGYGWFSCRVGRGADGASIDFAKLDGSQRPVGRIFLDTNARGIFLGTMELGDETRPMAYGRDGNRDMAGVFERIAPQRWRLVLPYPKFESILDVIELVPAA